MAHITRHSLQPRGPLLNLYRPMAGDGCVLYCPGQNDPQSAVLRDISGNNNNGTIVGATWARLPSGLWMLDFDGGDDYISVATNPAYVFATNFTLSAWVKIDDWAFTGGHYVIVEVQDRIFWHFPSSASQQLRIQQEGAWDNVDSPGGSLYSSGIWYHVAATFDVTKNPNTRMYRNGNEEANGNITAPLAGAKPIWIGSYQNLNHYLDGKLYPGIVSNATWSASQIAREYFLTRHLFGV